MDEPSLTHAAPFRIADCRVEPASLRVCVNGTETRMEAKAMRLLVYLSERAGRVVGREELERQLWPGRIVTEDSVTSAIAKLRRVFGDDARHPRVIETVPKSGYRLIAEVAPLASAEAARDEGGGRYWSRLAGGGLIVLLMLAMAGLLDWVTAPSVAPLPGVAKPAIAVLPFDNLGAAPEEDYFANGITADLITDLSKAQGLLVIAPGSTFLYRDGTQGARRISTELAVDYVVLGSVQRQGDKLRINVQLIEAKAEQALWGERYSGSMSEIFDIQDRLSAALIGALKARLAPLEWRGLAGRPTESVIAYDHYLRGIEAHGRRNPAQNLSAREHFQQAIAADATFARAYAGMSLTFSREAIDGWVANPAESLETAAAWTEEAARWGPSIPQVHFATGQVELFRRRHALAIAAAERAIEINPNYADGYALLAWILNYSGRSGHALSALNRALQLNPRPPASYLEILGEVRFTQGDYAGAANTFQDVLNINPAYARARMWNAAALARLGLREEAEWEMIELLAASPKASLSRLTLAFPFKDPRALEGVPSALRSAGLPER